jgi:FtsP/CotA-like multicopper oxidase with cupredoxin domain
VTHSQSNRDPLARSFARSFAGIAFAAGALAAGSAQAATVGITGGTGATAVFNLAASPSTASMPDGAQLYTWAYGCGVAPAGATAGAPAMPQAPAGFLPAGLSATPACGLGQLPGPTLIVTEGQTVTVNLYNGLPAVAGNTSIVFSGFAATATGGTQGLVTQEVAPGSTVAYTFVANRPGTYAYYSGSRSELQVEMGLYGALVVLPATPFGTPPASSTVTTSGGACSAANPSLRGLSLGAVGGADFRLSSSAYDHAATCYDREYLFQFQEMDSNIHNAAQACVAAGAACTQINVATDPYHPNYFLINGRAFPDNEDPNYAPMYPNQPYNTDPQMHPGEMALLRVIGQGRWQHPFHIHANHGRIAARDGNLLLSATDATALAGPLYYTLPTVSGQAQDVLFTYTGKGLNWDMYGHNLNRNPPLPTGPTPSGATIDATTGAATYTVTSAGGTTVTVTDPTPCFADANGYYTINSVPRAPATAANYFEWCADHNKPIPVTPPDPQIVANGLWYGGTPYLGLTQIPAGGGAPQFLSTPLPPGTNIQNPSAGYAFMWHSHAERELTTNDVFPGGMLIMMIVQPPLQQIDETL